jgi:hypothetical protein
MSSTVVLCFVFAFGAALAATLLTPCCSIVERKVLSSL